MGDYCRVIVNVEALYDKVLTYRGEAAAGSLVRVPLGQREVAGLVLGSVAGTDEGTPEDLKSVLGSLYDGHSWLDNSLLALAERLSLFYLSHLGSALEVMLPVPFALREVAGWQKGRARPPETVASSLLRPEPASLSIEQADALQRITELLQSKSGKPLLLHGITGSGKTEVYFQAISGVLEQGGQAIYLVPEISLTPQVYANLKQRFGSRVALIHSGMSPGLRARAWREIQAGNCDIVLGPRSAVFAPLPRLSLVIIDEEHESSYRHEGGLNYHARVAAQLRIAAGRGLVVLGSATPSLEVYYSAKRGRTELVSLTSRPGVQQKLPQVHVVDMREELRLGLSGMLSDPLRNAMQSCLGAGQQALLFLNRRGYGIMSQCTSCGNVAMCPRCDVSLHPHATGNVLKCHYCGFAQPTPSHCPVCGSERLRSRGSGTERLEEELRVLFPHSEVTRVDADTTTRKGAHERILSAFGNSPGHILMGTKMITKGLDFPLVTVVGVMDADSGLYFPDFRSVEETFQLITQVAGRAGRADLPGDVYIQTYNPANYAVRMAGDQDYDSFFAMESKMRRRMSYPPYGAMATLHFRGSNLERVRASALCAVRTLEEQGLLSVLGPAPSFPERVNNVFRWQVTLKSPERPVLQRVLRECQSAILAGCEKGVHTYIMLD